jgi:hypothetical protein
MLCLWLLEKLTYEENLPLTVHGRFVAHEGDIAVLKNYEGAIELGQVVKTSEHHNTIYMRLYRRPK